jgi:RecA-family ATPase
VLDTKNRMMVGDENSATDVAVMVRAMDELRTAAGACGVLVDHRPEQLISVLIMAAKRMQAENGAAPSRRRPA